MGSHEGRNRRASSSGELHFPPKYDVMTCHPRLVQNTMARKPRSNQAKPRRTGRPMQVYFRIEQREWIRTLAKQRHVTDSEVVRVAVDLLIKRLADGELDPPLGLT